MTTLDQIRPTTLVGVKRLAKALKSARGCTHIEALNAAAIVAGFQNFAHAQRNLQDSGPPPTPRYPPVWLSAYWHDKELGAEGRETLRLELSSEWNALINPAKLREHRAFSGFWAVAPDHLEERFLQKSQSQARRTICEAARTLQFMAATGLRPSRGSSRVFRGAARPFQLPGHDHSSVWYDSITKRYLLADEPYQDRANQRETERTSWAAVHGIETARPSWPGMYNPEEAGTRLHLFSQKGVGIPLGPVVEKLNQLPQPLIEQTWNGESASRNPYFTTPRHGQPLIVESPKSSHMAPVRLKGKREMPWGRKLLVLAANHLLQNQLMSLNGSGGEEHYCEAVIAGRNSIIQWHDIGFQELRISVWWDYDHSRHPQANLTGNSKEQFRTPTPLANRQHYRRFVGATVSGWLERKNGKFLQGKGKRGLFDLYRRQEAIPTLEVLPVPEAKGFLAEGRVVN